MKDFVRSRCQRIAVSRYYTEEGVKRGILIPRDVRPFDSLGRQNVNDSVLSHFVENPVFTRAGRKVRPRKRLDL